MTTEPTKTSADGTALLGSLAAASDREAIRFGNSALSYRELRDVAAALAGRLEGPVAWRSGRCPSWRLVRP